MKIFQRLIVLLFCCCPLLSQAQNPPTLNKNAWNFIFVQSFESNPNVPSNLSIKGFNHANLFGQMLTSATAGMTQDIRQIYAWDGSSSPPNNMATLQSINPFAVLNNLGVIYSQVSTGGPSTYNSPTYNIYNILAN